MRKSHKRRIGLTSYWASTRISVLDGHEQYEDSYAITQEFREWITCSSDHPEQLSSSILMVPSAFMTNKAEETNDTDKLLER